MPRRVCPVVQGYGANVYAHSISGARVPVDSNVGSVYSHFLRRFYGSPNFVSVMFAYNFSVLLKIRVYRQKLFTISNAGKTENIRLSTPVYYQAARQERRTLPQLVKGGKYAYGWSEVSSTGQIAVPSEALAEYNLTTQCKVILLSGSARSGGFALTTVSLLKNSVLSRPIDENPMLARFQLPEGEAITVAGKPWCWVKLNTDGCITVPLQTLKQYGVNAGDRLLAVRGSRFALAFCVKGPVIDEAKRHPSLAMFK
jgi:hypothetical protein